MHIGTRTIVDFCVLGLLGLAIYFSVKGKLPGTGKYPGGSWWSDWKRRQQ